MTQRPVQPDILNRYIKKTAQKESSCFICTKFTPTVLTNESTDFFYVCQSHLSDINFCKPIPEPTVEPPPPAPDTADADDDTNAKDAPKDKEEQPKQTEPSFLSNLTKVFTSSTVSLLSKSSASISAPSAPITFALSKNYYYLRNSAYQKKISQKARTAKNSELLTQMPSVPSTPLP